MPECSTKTCPTCSLDCFPRGGEVPLSLHFAAVALRGDKAQFMRMAEAFPHVRLHSMVGVAAAACPDHDKGLSLLTWMHATGKCQLRRDVADVAAMSGNLAACKWWFDAHRACMNREQLILYAVRGGQIHVLEWLMERMPVDEVHESAGDEAVWCGQRDAFEWLRARGCPMNIESALIIANVNNDSEFEAYLHGLKMSM